MCVAALPAVLSVAGTAMSAVGSMQQGKAQSKLAQQNAAIAKQNAQAERASAAEQESRFRNQARLFMSRHRAARAGQGVSLSEGSPLIVAAEQAGQLELDALTMRYEGEVKARGYEAEADYQTQLARQYKKAGLMGAATELITGLSPLASRLSGRSSASRGGGGGAGGGVGMPILRG